ncbi:Lactobacillus shifted protein [Fulvia fulva]|uniref:Lactobacillus shifted protein n=1 Tax=Passalora fulva TaxID=5499 RepID=A0A9Q8PA06_PASFU|nr:Lactobacillus shifted protein [Fulvia fulva]KAK4622317.1 Lactobacillus shifted protein [Fulvia fulva]KAK4622947.1 Lactobacillus shifted protein [Fulvia fulva]UJO18637.1 Lactobacillus shifted protein [Fulvia fulva]WPV16339.1 Lactobacillus shifted protein [Fulvia fulva]WPV30773.1 Lactobacillus shifted protein [Fulvia fulva]
MLQRSARRLVPALSRRTVAVRQYSTPPDNPIPANDPNAKERNPPISGTKNLPTVSMGSRDAALMETAAEGEDKRVQQAPNRATTWSRSQRERAKAMVGPRFEQTIMEDQPRPLAAIELIHQQPVNWTKQRVVSCDGGGGPLGHPRIFINVDKPQICFCTYCGLPFAHEHHRKHLQSLPHTSYPLEPQSNAAEIPASQMAELGGKTGSDSKLQSVTGKVLEQR